MEKVNVEPLVREYLECLLEGDLDNYKEKVLARLFSDEVFINKLSSLLRDRRQKVKKKVYKTKLLAALPGDDYLLKKILTETVEYHAENFDSYVFKYLYEADIFSFIRGLGGRVRRFKGRLPKKNCTYDALEKIIEKNIESKINNLELILSQLQRKAMKRELGVIAAMPHPRKGHGKPMQKYLTDFTCFTYDQAQMMFSYAPARITCLLCNELFRTSHFKKEALKKTVLRKKNNRNMLK